MKTEDLHYLAGLFDGEGTIYITRYRASKNGAWYRKLVLTISNTYLPVLQWAAQVIGDGAWAGLSSRKETHKACNARKDAYKIHMTGKKAKAFALLLRPYLRIKGPQVDRVLAGPISGRMSEEEAEAHVSRR